MLSKIKKYAEKKCNATYDFTDYLIACDSVFLYFYSLKFYITYTSSLNYLPFFLIVIIFTNLYGI